MVQAAAALWCLIHFGGIGTRARRGAGNLRVASVDNPQGIPIPEFAVSAPSANELQAYLARGLARVFAVLEVQPTHNRGETFPKFCLDRVEFAVWKTLASDYREAMNQFGMKFQGTDAQPGFRLRHGCGKGGDYDIAKAILKGETPANACIERAAFGLPLSFRFKDVQGSLSLDARNAEKKTERRGSPLWVHFQPLASGKIATVLTWLKGDFMPGHTLKAKGRRLAPPSGEIISEFLDYLGCHRWTMKEVLPCNES